VHRQTDSLAETAGFAGSRAPRVFDSVCACECICTLLDEERADSALCAIPPSSPPKPVEKHSIPAPPEQLLYLLYHSGAETRAPARLLYRAAIYPHILRIPPISPQNVSQRTSPPLYYNLSGRAQPQLADRLRPTARQVRVLHRHVHGEEGLQLALLRVLDVPPAGVQEPRVREYDECAEAGADSSESDLLPGLREG